MENIEVKKIYILCPMKVNLLPTNDREIKKDATKHHY